MIDSHVSKLVIAGALVFFVSACTSTEDDRGQDGATADEEVSEAAAEVVTTPSGLQYEILVEGDGETPGLTDSVKVHYRGTLLDGTEFDSSHKRGQPAVFPVNRVIKGWTEALLLMQEGDKWKLTIPPDLAYGSRGAGSLIGPDETLVFEVELIEVQ